MAQTLDAEHRALIRRETTISAVLAGVLPAVAMWFLAGPFPMPLGGGEGFAVFLAKNTLGMVTVMTLLMTLGVRGQIAKGKVPRLSWRQDGHAGLKFVPTWILLRAPLYGVLALLILAPIGLLIARGLGFDQVDRLPFVLFNLVYGSTVALIVAPLILIATMNDPVRPPRTGLRASQA